MKKSTAMFAGMGKILYEIQKTEFIILNFCHISYKYFLSDNDKNNLPNNIKNKFNNLTNEMIQSDSETSKIVLGMSEKFISETSTLFDTMLLTNFRNKRNHFVHEYFLRFKNAKNVESELKYLLSFENEILYICSIFQGWMDYIEKLVDIKQGKTINTKLLTENEKNFFKYLVEKKGYDNTIQEYVLNELIKGNLYNKSQEEEQVKTADN